LQCTERKGLEPGNVDLEKRPD